MRHKYELVEAEYDPLHIEFRPRDYREGVVFRNLLEDEMKLRNIQFSARQSSQELRITLAEILLVEKSFQLVTEVVSASNLDEAMTWLEQALPDLLHLENRSSETIIEHLLRRGISLRECDKQLTEQLIKEVECIMNEEIFGTVGCRSNWKFPVNEDGSMGPIKFANWRARRVVGNLDPLIELCLPGDGRAAERNQWMEAVTAYQATIQV